MRDVLVNNKGKEASWRELVKLLYLQAMVILYAKKKYSKN